MHVITRKRLSEFADKYPTTIEEKFMSVPC